MMKLTVALAAAMLVGFTLAGDTVISVEHGDGHVDNDYRQGGGGIIEGMANMNHDKIHHGDGHSIHGIENEMGHFDHDDHATGTHHNLLHEEGDDLPFHSVAGADLGVH
jgi:hypothetical protein